MVLAIRSMFEARRLAKSRAEKMLFLMTVSFSCQSGSIAAGYWSAQSASQLLA